MESPSYLEGTASCTPDFICQLPLQHCISRWARCMGLCLSSCWIARLLLLLDSDKTRASPAEHATPAIFWTLSVHAETDEIIFSSYFVQTPSNISRVNLGTGEVTQLVKSPGFGNSGGSSLYPDGQVCPFATLDLEPDLGMNTMGMNRVGGCVP